MAYFEELPNIEYISPFDDSNSNSDYVPSKNIFLRAKLREGIVKNVTSFEYYYIKDGERPDTIAEKAYDDPELDWVILTINNITNLNSQWPLDNLSFHKYLLEKYGSEEKIYDTHHYETLAIKDQYNRTILNQNYEVDPGFTRSFTTEEGKSFYNLSSYQDSNLSTTVSINLNQILDIVERYNNTKIKINDIKITNSTLSIPGRIENYNITLNNDLLSWPTGWGGNLPVTLRSGNIINVSIGDELGDTYIPLPEYLYELTRTQIDRKINTQFKFIPQT